MILAAHVRTKDLGNIDAAVGVQVVLEERDEHTRGSDDGVVERVGEIELAVLAADADLQTARLRVAEIRAGADLKVLLLARAPRFDIAALNLEIGKITRAALKLTHRDLQRAEQLHAVAPHLFVPVHALLGLADNDHFLLFKLVDAVNAALLDAVRALLLAEAGGIARVGDGELLLGDDAVDERADHGVLARADEIEILALDLVHHGVHVGLGHDALHHVAVDHVGGNVVHKALVDHKVARVREHRGVQAGDIAAQIVEAVAGDAARRVSGNGFYYLRGDIARLHSAVLAYARDFMIDKGFVYYIPPYMIHGDVVQGVMSQTDMDAMMYKIEGEDLYLIGTSEHSMIGSFIDRIVPEKELPITYTSYSPCFRKEKGAHGIEERGVYRIHQFEKQEMIVVCKPEESMDWYEKMWRYSVELFRSLEIPVRQLECCSGDLADLKVKSCDIEAWSPRQQKYFEVCSCSNLGDAQARRLKIRVRGEDGKLYLAHTLNNTVVAPPRMLIAFLENHLHADGSVDIPEVLRPYMGGKDHLEKK